MHFERVQKVHLYSSKYTDTARENGFILSLKSDLHMVSNQSKSVLTFPMSILTGIDRYGECQ